MLSNFIVLVGLGSAKDDSDFVMNSIREKKSEVVTDKRFTNALTNIMKRPWFRRTWVLQEFVLNKSMPQLACGSVPHVPWDLFSEAISGLLDTYGDTVTGNPFADASSLTTISFPTIGSVQLFEDTRSRFIQQSSEDQPYHLGTAGAYLRYLNATDPRDKIYGLIGLLDSKTRKKYQEIFIVDYSKSVEEVYRDATKHILTFENLPTIYDDFEILGNRPKNWPSWVLDYRLPLQLPIPLFEKAQNLALAENAQISYQDHHLLARGILLDKIDNVIDSQYSLPRLLAGNADFSFRLYPAFGLIYLGSTIACLLLKITNPGDPLPSAYFISIVLIHMHNILAEFLKLIRSIDSIMSTSSHIQDRERRLPEPLWRTLLIAHDPTILDDSDQCQADFDLILNAVRTPESQLLSRLGAVGSVLRGTIHQFDNIAINFRVLKTTLASDGLGGSLLFPLVGCLSDRTFFVGCGMWYGVCASGIRKGDKLVLLFPPRWLPFVLRLVGDNCYEIIAPAYVPKLMREQAIQRCEGEAERFDII
jgi:hypothetical protein